jgi:nucleotide-binding universal stress UspA family protein
MTSTQFANPPVIPLAPAPVMKRILFATDFSPASRHALRKAIDTAQKEGAELIIAHVYEPPSALSLEGVDYQDMDRKLRATAQKELDAVAATVRANGVRVRGVLLAGNAAEGLIGVANENGVELLVMGTHGRTGLKKLVMGSVASHVVATAPCPVLTVH